MSTDPATARLGQYLTISFGVHALCGLIGVGGGSLFATLLVDPVLIVLGILLARGVRQARTLLLVITWFALLLSTFLVVLAFTTGRYLILLLAVGAVALAAAQMVALAFTVPEAGVAGGLPERWRPWGTSVWLHLVLLFSGLVAAFAAAA